MKDHVKYYLSLFMNKGKFKDEVAPDDLHFILDDYSVKFIKDNPNVIELKNMFSSKDSIEKNYKVLSDLAEFLISFGKESVQCILDNVDTTEEELKKNIDNSYRIYRKKNHDYGDSYSYTLDTYGLATLFVRLSDKCNRLMSLTHSNHQEVLDESIYDTYIDLLNYTAMALNYLTQKTNHTFYLEGE